MSTSELPPDPTEDEGDLDTTTLAPDEPVDGADDLPDEARDGDVSDNALPGEEV